MTGWQVLAQVPHPPDISDTKPAVLQSLGTCLLRHSLMRGTAWPECIMLQGSAFKSAIRLLHACGCGKQSPARHFCPILLCLSCHCMQGSTDPRGAAACCCRLNCRCVRGQHLYQRAAPCHSCMLHYCLEILVALLMLTFAVTLQVVVLTPPQPLLPHQVSSCYLASLSLEHWARPGNLLCTPCDAEHCCLTGHCTHGGAEPRGAAAGHRRLTCRSM